MGDEIHAILNCPRFNDVRQNFIFKIEILVPNFKELNDYNKLYYMLTCEDESVRLVSRFLAEVLSAQRLSFEKIWREVNNPDEIEFLLRIRNQRHFGQAETDGTPFTSEAMKKKFDWQAMMAEAAAVLNGTYIDADMN